MLIELPAFLLPFVTHFHPRFIRETSFQTLHFEVIPLAINPSRVRPQKHLDWVAELAGAKRWCHPCHKHGGRICMAARVGAAVADSQYAETIAPVILRERLLSGPSLVCVGIKKYSITVNLVQCPLP
ncbi:hypothetical protein G7047_09630 [Diaphorobacter sp. HDW4A]|uniref:hypothetical protein n=1 Tax=Diaphorobacter sp. HDW4A TaxID=2714924 RepID=UPI00140D6AE5|nr:hypothetical protein [Diaphorobacter sp. HDW4A]QIL80135.1 hypothetical protein G7047_09630 [Diaphorobacter sp. HDW4A]